MSDTRFAAVMFEIDYGQGDDAETQVKILKVFGNDDTARDTFAIEREKLFDKHPDSEIIDNRGGHIRKCTVYRENSAYTLVLQKALPIRG